MPPGAREVTKVSERRQVGTVANEKTAAHPGKAVEMRPLPLPAIQIGRL